MSFYTYEYVLSRTHTLNISQWVIIFLILIGLVVMAYFWIHKKLDYRFKEVGVLVLIILFLLIGLQINSYNISRNSDNTYGQVLSLMESVSEKLGIEKENLQVNRLNLVKNPIVSVKDKFYEVHLSDDAATFVIEKIQIENQQEVKVIDVEGSGI